MALAFPCSCGGRAAKIQVTGGRAPSDIVGLTQHHALDALDVKNSDREEAPALRWSAVDLDVGSISRAESVHMARHGRLFSSWASRPVAASSCAGSV